MSELDVGGACPACGAAQPPDARFCFSCGTTLTAPRCGACGAAVVTGARFCSACGTPVSPRELPAPGGRPTPAAARRVTSVLFGDLVAFTSWSEHRDQEEVREMLSRYFETCRSIVARYGGTVEKFIGDAVMAVWGVPTAHEDDAERSVRAALDLVSEVAALGELPVPGAAAGAEEAPAPPALRLRVGIVTGEVAVTIGAEQQGMVAGDPVNTAARVQASARPGEVWVDDTTRSLTSSAISYADEGTHTLKGRTGVAQLWSARAVTGGVRGLRRADELEAPLLGRDRELRLLKELFHATEDSGRPQLVVVDGGAGLGKTRLAWELEKYLDGLQARVGLLVGRCAAYGDGVAFQPLADAVRGRLRAAGRDPSSPLHDEALLDALPDLVEDEAEVAWLRPRLAVLLGTGPASTFAREDLFAAWTAFLEHVAARGQAAVWVVDDAQHADESFLRFLDHVLRAATVPLLVVLLTRPDLLEAQPWLVTSTRTTVLRLAPLRDPDMAGLVDALVDALPGTARDALVERSDGIPLYAVETVRALASGGQVARSGGRYVVEDPEGVDLGSVAAPQSLQAVVRARLDRLAPDQRTVVERASVLGNAFSEEAVRALCGDVPGLEAVLTELVQLEVLRKDLRRGSPELGRYRFGQAIVAQVALGMLSRHERKANHLAAARHLESHDEAGDLAPVVAAHLADALEAVPDAADAARLTQELVGQLVRAADRLRALGAPAEAAAHLRSALRRTGDERLRAELRGRLAWALADAGRWTEVLEPAARATAQYDEWGDDVAAADVAVAHANALMAQAGDNEAARALLEPRWRALQDRVDAAPVLLGLAAALNRATQRLSLDTRPIVEARLRLADLVGDQEALADTYVSLAVHYLQAGARSLTEVLLEQAIALGRQHHRGRVLGRALTNLSAYTVAEDLARAELLGREAVSEATRSGMQLMHDYSSLNLSLARFALGDWAGLRETLSDPDLASDRSNLPMRVALRLELDRARGEVGDLPWQRGVRDLIDSRGPQAWQTHCEAIVAWQEGDEQQAARSALAAVEALHASSGMTEDLPMMWPTAAEIVLAVGDDAALDRLLEIAELADRHVPAALRAHRRWAEGMRAAATGSVVEAAAVLEEAVKLYEAWGSAVYAARARVALAEVMLRSGRDHEAVAAASRAREVLGRLGADAWLAGLRA